MDIAKYFRECASDALCTVMLDFHDGQVDAVEEVIIRYFGLESDYERYIREGKETHELYNKGIGTWIMRGTEEQCQAFAYKSLIRGIWKDLSLYPIRRIPKGKKSSN